MPSLINDWNISVDVKRGYLRIVLPAGDDTFKSFDASQVWTIDFSGAPSANAQVEFPMKVPTSAMTLVWKNLDNEYRTDIASIDTDPVL